MRVQIQWRKAELICGQLLTALRNDEFPYGETWALPQTFIPDEVKNNDLLHARFLFYCCHYMRGTIKSDHAIKCLIVLYGTHPELFDPFQAQLPENLPILERELGELIGYKTPEISSYWQENSRRMVEHWNGDPRRIFIGVSDAESMYRFVTNKSKRAQDPMDPRTMGFLGFQKKMSSMLAYFLMDAGLLESIMASPPVDFHLLRVMLASGILKVRLDSPDERIRYEHLTPHGIRVLKRYVQNHGVTLVELGNALWMLSVVLCSRAPGNGSSGRRKGVHGKLIRPQRIVPDWGNPEHRQQYLNSCALCPINGSCVLHIPSGPYYQGGEFMLAKRMPPTAHDLHPLLIGGDLPISRRPARMLKTVLPSKRVRLESLFGDLPVQRVPKKL